MNYFEIVVMILLASGCASLRTKPPGQEKLPGSWIGIYLPKKVKVEATFYPDGRLALAFDNIRVGEESAPGAAQLTYHVSTDSVPWRIDVGEKVGGTEKIALRGILQLIDDRSLRVGIELTPGPDGVPRRPESFTAPGSDVIEFKKTQ